MINTNLYERITELTNFLGRYAPRLASAIILLSMITSVGSAAYPLRDSQFESIDASSSFETAAINSIFGVEETPLIINDAKTTGLIKMTNSKTVWVRGPEIVWSEIESVENSYDWSKMQSAVDELDEILNLGYTPIMVVRGTPAWAQIANSSTCGPIKADKFDDFGKFIQDAMEELADQGKYVQFWEIWNEPDVDPSIVPPDSWYAGCWGDANDPYYGGRYYSKMLTVVYQMIKSKDPNAQVLSGGLNLLCDPIDPHPDCDTLPAEFFRGVLIDGGGNNFDGVSFHAYDGYGSEYGTYGNIWWKSFWNATGPSLIAKSNYLRYLLGSYGVVGKYLMSTENALICEPCDDDPTFEATKANYLADSYASAIAYGLAANIWFDVLGSWLRNNGLVNNQDLSELPALDAYNTASELLEGASLVRTILEYEGVYGFEFKTPNPNFHVWTMRSIDGQNYPVQFAFTPLYVYDVYGEDITDELTEDNKIDVSVAPIYAVMPSSVPRMAMPLTMNQFKNFGNGDFEDGPSSWNFVNQGLPPSLVSESPISPITGNEDSYIPDGDYSAQLGNFGYACNEFGVPTGYAAVEQQLFVPDVSGSVAMEFDYIIYTQDWEDAPMLDPSDYDRFEVYVLSASGSELTYSDANKQSPWGCSNWRRIPGTKNPRNGNVDGWARGSFSLDDYQGESILVSFQNWNRPDGWYNTVTFLDNVELVYSP